MASANNAMGASAGVKKPKNPLPVGSAHCQCSGCSRLFRSAHGFDKHRFEGRCLTEEEMRGKGMEPNEEGLWRGAPKERGGGGRV